jgi:hypothetical protein
MIKLKMHNSFVYSATFRYAQNGAVTL